MPWVQGADGDWVWTDGPGDPAFVAEHPQQLRDPEAAAPPPPMPIARAPAETRLADDLHLPSPGGLPAEQMASANRHADPKDFKPIYQNEMQLNDPEFRAYALEVNARGDGIDIGLGMEIDGETGKPIRPIPRMFRLV